LAPPGIPVVLALEMPGRRTATASEHPSAHSSDGTGKPDLGSSAGGGRIDVETGDLAVAANGASVLTAGGGTPGAPAFSYCLHDQRSGCRIHCATTIKATPRLYAAQWVGRDMPLCLQVLWGEHTCFRSHPFALLRAGSCRQPLRRCRYVVHGAQCRMLFRKEWSRSIVRDLPR